MKLARLAVQAAVAVPGVAAPHRSPMHRTADSATTAEGVLVVAQSGERYSVSLHLVARPVPLEALGRLVRSEVEVQVAQAGLADALGTLTVRFEDIAEATATEAGS